MTNIRPIRGGDGPRAPETIAEAIEQFAARVAAVAPQCVMLVLQRGEDEPEVFAVPAAKSVKLGIMSQVSDLRVPSPFVGDEE